MARSRWSVVAAQNRAVDQGRNHRGHLEHQLSLITVGVLAHNRVLHTELELDWQLADQRGLRDTEAYGHIPLVAGCGPGVVGNGRVEGDLPGARQVEGEEVEQVHIAGVADAGLTRAAGADPEVVLAKCPERHSL